ncbi:ABC transporter ATP-binding protein [Lactiplantibacillus plantarum]|uniref:ABC transporter ATP-binding protein n=1 Tax=Lactiplantibacillus plantarum TaxID=1590 RepID=UPI0021A5174D|nr:ABC transporter ATP-binding protein [Lactiplantibacillus plantarum]MCT3214137.1 ABC transporter ATP-binding protein [Lactiplantibacillus plantarum]MCT3271723.1 ABC transporter ATP-binding protein [Lactiplantibacillus plantarum]
MVNKSVLEVHHLNKSFKQRQVLKDINFCCSPGRIVGLIGANGAGKTTTMKIILGLIHDDGKVLINGERVTFYKHQALQNVGALIEEPGLYPFLSGRDCLKMVTNPETTQQTVDSIITDLKIEAYIDKRTNTYSLGMRQKLGIAMALVNSPKLVILDEPMNGLDPSANQQLRELIKRRAQAGTTFLISSHILSELQKIADDVLLLDHGEIVKNTTMNALLAGGQHYLLMKTSNDIKTKKLLIKAGYQLAHTDEIKILKRANFKLNPLLIILAANNIEINDIQHLDEDLEQSVLTTLRGEN